MKKVTWFFLFFWFIFLMNNAYAQLSKPIVVDQLGIDCEWHYYLHNSLGPRIAVDENDAVHVVYRKAWAAEADTGFALFYKNVTTGAMDTIRSQEPEQPIKPSRAFIGGGRGTVPLFILTGLSTYNFRWDQMPLQAMSKVDENSKVVPLGIQPDKNYYHDPWYALPISMEVDATGIAHVILTNVDGQALSYWNFDGTNFSEITAMYNVYPDEGVPGKDVPDKYKRNATKGADLAITKDGSTVAVGGLHPWNNIDVTFGYFGGEIWPNDMYSGMDEGSFIFLFDTTNVATGDNIDHSMAMPATDLQLAYDDYDVLHIVYEAAWFSQYLDTLDLTPADRPNLTEEQLKWSNNWGGNDAWRWYTTYYYLAGDMNAVYYGSGKPKPQILYWNSTMPLMASSTAGHIKIAESVYPLPGEEYKWWRKAVIDSGMGIWSNRTDCIIDEVDLVINTDAQEGEPKGVVVWEEIGSEPTIIEDSDLRYVGYYRDILVSVTDDFINWSPGINITNTPYIDDSEVSVYQDIVNGKVHMVYNSDNLPMSDYFLNWTGTYTGTFLSGPTQRANPNDKVNLVYYKLDLDELQGFPSDLVAHYTFEDDASDVTGNGYDGTLLGDAHVDGGLLILDGDDDAVDIPRIGGEGATFSAVTYAMWIYTNVDLASTQFAGGINTRSWVEGAIHFKLNYGKVNVGINEIEGGDLTGTTMVEPNTWYHIALTVDGTDIALYLNGALEDSRTLSVPVTNLIVGDGIIGAWTNPDIQRELNGMMEDVRIYDRGLSALEVLKLATETVISDVASKENSSNIPEKFNLLQNYPNPFNPITHIRYDLANDVKATLKVYDILGREVMTVFNEKQQAGFYTVTLDASNIPSGIYFYRLEAGDNVFTKKMTLLK